MALGILSVMQTDQLVACVMRNDLAALVKLPGIGKKTAERLVIDLRDRLKHWEVEGGDAAGKRAPVAVNDAVTESENALVSLGYKPVEASRAIVQAVTLLESEGKTFKTELLLRVALKALAKSTH